MQIKVHLGEARTQYWYSNALFSFQWWFSVFVPLGFVWIWIKLYKRSQLVETVLYGLLWATTASYLDFVGTSFLLWEYPYTILPYSNKDLSANLTSIPIAFMLVYQYCSTIKSFTGGTVAIAIFFAFVMEPFLVWLGLYKLYHWTFCFSFILYIVFSFVFRWLTKKIIAAQLKQEK
ncbi:CBO0543 family protein [Lucifera butyrica]